MYCKNCGAELDDRAVVCPHCGVATGAGEPVSAKAPASDDAPSGGFLALCLFFPLIGLILYLVWKDQYPQRAKSCGKGAIIGVILGVVIGIVGGIIMGITMANTLTGYSLFAPLIG